MKKHIMLGSVAGLAAVLVIAGITHAGTDSPIIDRILANLKSLTLKVNSIKQPIVRDANGTEVGILLGNQGGTDANGFQANYGAFEVYDVNHNVTARLYASTGQPNMDFNFGTKLLLFSTPDCSGQAYVSNVNGTQIGEVMNNINTLVMWSKANAADELYAGVEVDTNKAIESRLTPSDDCLPIVTATPGSALIYPMVTAVNPITMPYVGPLTINLE